MKSFMFPLFWRIFISIWLAMAVTVVASNLATRYLLDRERQAIERQVGLHEIAREALNLRNRENRGEMWRFLRSEGERLDLHSARATRGARAALNQMSARSIPLTGRAGAVRRRAP